MRNCTRVQHIHRVREPRVCVLAQNDHHDDDDGAYDALFGAGGGGIIVTERVE